MKTQLTLLSLLATVTLLPAQSFTTNSYPLNPSAGISDGNPVGLMEQFTVAGLSGVVADVQVNLNITGGFNGDLYAYLAGPQGQLAVLLNRVGVTGSNPLGYSDAGMNITLDGAGVNNIHDYQTIPSYSLNGTVWAADGRNVNPQASGGTIYSTLTTSGLGVFNSSNPNGMWTLFIADMSAGGGVAVLNSAILNVITVPEPSTWAMFGIGLLLLGLHWKKRASSLQK